jgi:hypothetical protein
MIHNKLKRFYGGGVVSPPPNPQAGGLPPVGCPRLLIQYICSYSPYLKAVSSIRNLRKCHAVMTGDPLKTYILYGYFMLHYFISYIPVSFNKHTVGNMIYS